MVNPYEPPNSDVVDVPAENEPLKRHGCLTAFLVLMIIANSMTTLAYTFMTEAIRQAHPNLTNFQLAILLLGGIANVIFAFALLKWRRWGFYGSLITAFIAFVINYSLGLSVGKLAAGGMGIVVLYALLHVGGDRRAWPRLR